MNITLHAGSRLTAEQIEAWKRLQQANPELDSPFFRPEFTQAVAAIRSDVEVAVVEKNGEPVAFFPFQRGKWDLGRPVGGRLSDFQGVVARQGFEWCATELICGCGLRSWDFDHLVASQKPFHRFSYGLEPSPYIDLSAGFEAYKEERRRAGSRVIRDTLGSLRRLEREVGPVCFEMHSDDPAVFDRFIEMKRSKYRSTGVTDVFAFDWTVQTLRQILASRDEAFCGMLSVLRVGDRVAAVEMGMRSCGVLHAWFPAYDETFARYSPGMILQVLLTQHAATLGIRRYDMGRGLPSYKARSMSGMNHVAEGSVALDPMTRLLRRGYYRARTWARSSSLGAPVRVMGRLTRPLRGWLAFR